MSTASPRGDAGVPCDVLDVLVVGAGIHGLCTAYHLRARGVSKIAVVERFPPGHARGSSHGASRIFRSSYPDAFHVALAREAGARGWPELAAAVGVAALTPAPGVFFGPPSPTFAAFAQATLQAGGAEEIDAAAARRMFPLLAIPSGDRVLLEHGAGILHADATRAALSAWLVAHGVDVRHETRVHAVHGDREALVAHTDHGAVHARRIVLACGAWIGALVPALAPRLTVLRQTVGYYRLDAPPPALAAPRFPVWARIGATANDFVYGLPEVGQPGVKLARHRTAGTRDDAEAAPAEPDPAVLADLDACARTLLGSAAPVRLRTETCLYTMTDDQRFVVDALPGEPRLVVVSACSGHGFKFAPVVGELAARILLDGAAPPPQLAIR